jgi:hypothetical protein
MKWQIRGKGLSGSWRACGALLLGMSALGCAEEETGFFIVGNVKLDAPECIARPEGTATLVDSGVLDVALRREYQATLLVGSQLAPRGDKTNLRTETMIATVTGAEVHLFTDTGERGPEFTVPASGVIRPDASDDPGFGVITATLIPAATANEFAAGGTDALGTGEVRTRIAVVTIFGETIGGVEFETSPFNYLVRVCQGCLVNFPADAISTSDGSCFGAATESQDVPCRFGQDEGVDCRTCSGSNNPFCRFPGGVQPP